MRWLFPVARPLVFLFFCLVKVLRVISPKYPNLNGLLHKTIHWGLRTFATPEANRVILRHFHVGSELTAFVRENAGVGDKVTKWPLTPTRLKDIEPDLFLQHDLNIFNFVIEMNAVLRAEGRELMPPERIDFSMISDEFPPFEEFPRKWHNFVDVQTAVEFYTPIYALMLPRDDRKPRSWELCALWPPLPPCPLELPLLPSVSSLAMSSALP